MKQENGLVSLMMMYVLMPLLMLAMVCVDGSRVLFAHQTVSVANDTVLENILGYYDADLKRIYGLYAAQPTPKMEEELLGYYLQSIRGSLSKTQTKNLVAAYVQNGGIDSDIWSSQTQRKSSGSMTNLNGISVLKKPTIMPVKESSLYNSDILKYQIVEYMKYRGPMSMAENILQKIGILKGQSHSTKSHEKQLKEDKQQFETIKKLYALHPKMVKLNEYIEQLTVFNVANASQLIERLNKQEDPQQFINSARMLMSEYHSELDNTLSTIKKMNVEDHLLVKELIQNIEKEKVALQMQQKALQHLRVVQRTDVSDINQTNGQQKTTSEVSMVGDIEIATRELSNNMAFMQLLKITQSSDSGQMIDNIKNVYHTSTTSIQTTDVVTPIDQGQMPSVLKNELPNESNVFTDALNRVQGIKTFFYQAEGMSDVFGQLVNELLVSEYVTEMFTNYLDRPGVQTAMTKRTLLNGMPLAALHMPTRGAEVEYMLFGKANAQDNIQEVLRRIKLIRFVFNFAYTYSSAELRAMLFSSSLIAGPFAKGLEVLLHVLVALAETQLDEYLLLQGHSVAVVKTADTFKMQPSQMVNGMISFAQDEIVQRLNEGIDGIHQSALDWFEGSVETVEKTVVEKVDEWIMQQEKTIIDMLSQQIETMIHPLVTAQLTALQKGDSQLKEKIEEGFQNIETKLINVIQEHEALRQITNLNVLMKQSVHHLRESYVTLVEEHIKKTSASIGEGVNQLIQNYLKRLSHPIKNFVQQKAQQYKENVLEVVRHQTTKLTDQAKEKLKTMTQQFFSNTSQQFQTNTFPKGTGINRLTYIEYLKIFVLFELVTHPQTPLYTRMAQLIGQNVQLDLSKYHAVFEVTSTYQVETFILDWFKNEYEVTRVLGY